MSVVRFLALIYLVVFCIMLLIRGAFVDAVGFVIINNTDGEWDNTFTTGLADGTYCDVISGAVSGSSCTGTTYVYHFLSFAFRNFMLNSNLFS